LDWTLDQLVALIECVVKTGSENFFFIENCFYEGS